MIQPISPRCRLPKIINPLSDVFNEYAKTHGDNVAYMYMLFESQFNIQLSVNLLAEQTPLYRWFISNKDSVCVIDTSYEMWKERTDCGMVRIYDRIMEIAYKAGKTSDTVFILAAKTAKADKRPNVYRSNPLFYIQQRDKLPDIKSEPSKRYISLNAKPRQHRIALLDMLETAELLDQGYVSYNISNVRNKTKGIIYAHKVIPTEMCDKWANRSIVLDVNNVEISQYTKFADPDDMFNDSMVQVVAETSLHKTNPEIYITEKSLRPFMHGNMPLIIGMPGIIGYFRDNGFDVFDDFIDHTYDTITDHTTRLNIALCEVKRILTHPELANYRKQIYKRLILNQGQLQSFILNEYNHDANSIQEQLCQL